MILSDLGKIVDFNIIRDSSFNNLGFLSDPQEAMLTFFEDNSFMKLLKNSGEISCIITKEKFAGKFDNIKGLAVSADPRLDFIKIHNYLTETDFYWEDFPTRISRSAVVHPKAFIADKNVEIGPDSIIGPNATIQERCRIGKNVNIMAGVVTGSIGRQSTKINGSVIDMMHAGGLSIGDNVVIMPNSVIATAVFKQMTTIGGHSRIGNLVFISHNVHIGPNCFVGHGATINGNINIGKDVWIGPGSVISNNLNIGDNARVCLGSTVINDVKEGQDIIGSVAIEKRKMLRHIGRLIHKDEK